MVGMKDIGLFQLDNRQVEYRRPTVHGVLADMRVRMWAREDRIMYETFVGESYPMYEAVGLPGNDEGDCPVSSRGSGRWNHRGKGRSATVPG